MSNTRAELTIEIDGRVGVMIDCKVEWDRSRNQWHAFNAEGFEAWAETRAEAVLVVFAKHLGVVSTGTLILDDPSDATPATPEQRAAIDRLFKAKLPTVR